MIKKFSICLVIWIGIMQISLGQEKSYFIGSTMFMLANLIDDPEPPNYYQLNVGYRISEKDVLSLEMINWHYYEPLGVPLSKKKSAPNYPGKVKCRGAGLAYKRFLYRQAYAQVHSTLFRLQYVDESNQKIQNGVQMFNTLRLGYQFRFFNNRFFLEPSLAMTFWPISTNLPESFKVEEMKWNKYLLGEPGLHFGFNF